MAHTVHAFEYLANPEKYPAAPVCVLYGDEPFLKTEARALLRKNVLADDSEPYAALTGDVAEWRDVNDEVATVSLFGQGSKRLVFVQEADKFVTRHRTELEDYVEKPSPGGVLVLEVKVWLKTTRLFKAVEKTGLQIECSAPSKSGGKSKSLDEGVLVRWLSAWAKSRHNSVIGQDAAAELLDRVGPHVGMLDQELAKLALYVDPGGKITPELVRDHAGGWRTKTTWEMIDLALDGRSAAALEELGKLLQAGEHPVAIFGGLSWSLRRFNAATRIYQRAERSGQKIKLGDAMKEAGFRPWPPEALTRAENRLKRMGRDRAGQLYRWLLEADLALKGSHSKADRGALVLETLFLRLAEAAPAKAAR